MTTMQPYIGNTRTGLITKGEEKDPYRIKGLLVRGYRLICAECAYLADYRLRVDGNAFVYYDDCQECRNLCDICQKPLPCSRHECRQ